MTTARRPRTGTVALGVVQVLLAGAIVTNVAVLGVAAAVPATYLVLAAVIAWFRRDSIVGLVR